MDTVTPKNSPEEQLRAENAGLRARLEKAEASLRAEGLSVEDGTDSTARKVAERALRESETRMRLATEATAVGIWEWNVLTNAIRWDAQMFRIYGIAPTPHGFVQYSDWSGAVLPEDLPENERILQDTVRRAGQSRREFRIRRREDGEVRDIEAVETVRTNEQGQTEWVVGTNLDITARKQAEAAIQRMNAELEARVEERTAQLRTANDTLVGEMQARLRLEDEILEISEREQQRIGRDLHDSLCQHLAAVGLMTTVFARRVADPELKKEITAISGLMREATEQARMLAHGLVPVMVETNGLMAALQELSFFTSRVFSISCRLECPHPVQVGDITAATHLYRIAQEAISNAVKHGKAQTVVVSLSSSEGKAAMTIRDDGAGFQADTTGKSGMGLRSMEYRAERIGGSLIVSGEAGQGTTVKCIFNTGQ